MLRGNKREKIFRDEEDKSRIIHTLEDKRKAEEYALYAYCVMDNHIHLIIKEGKDPIASSVKRIAASYSYYSMKNINVSVMCFRKDLKVKILKMKVICYQP